MSVFNKNTRRVLSYDNLRQQKTGVMTKGEWGGLTSLRLWRITSSPSQTLYHRLVRTTDDGRRGECSTLAAVRPNFVAALFFTLRDSVLSVENTIDLYAAKPDIRPESRFLPTLLAFDTPFRGFPSEHRHRVWYGKTRMVWLPDGEKNFEDIFIRFDMIHERDRHTDTHEHTNRHRMTA